MTQKKVVWLERVPDRDGQRMSVIRPSIRRRMILRITPKNFHVRIRIRIRIRPIRVIRLPYPNKIIVIPIK